MWLWVIYWMLSALVFITVKWSIKDPASQGCHKDEVGYFTKALSFMAGVSLTLGKNIVVVISSLFPSSASPSLCCWCSMTTLAEAQLVDCLWDLQPRLPNFRWRFRYSIRETLSTRQKEIMAALQEELCDPDVPREPREIFLLDFSNVC